MTTKDVAEAFTALCKAGKLYQRPVDLTQA
jgi:hypothetical protein